jgi:hypothetical protein
VADLVQGGGAGSRGREGGCSSSGGETSVQVWLWRFDGAEGMRSERDGARMDQPPESMKAGEGRRGCHCACYFRLVGRGEAERGIEVEQANWLNGIVR